MNDDFPDRLSLLGMRFEALHGVLASEKVDPQPFEVDLVLHVDLDDVARTDALEDTVDYRGMHELVDSIVMGPSFNLIEGLAGAIARAVLAGTDPRLVGAVEVRVRKPEAPLPGELDTVEAALLRRRPDVAGE
ncbi:MAG TPA: dihydroneopterin aldolase [Candidatus Limnocylindria bacterium]|jgi:dihydroneopterin aldolase|nr:dihydroneopterin aldolase [Candidatus Limnocylindria bacterium]